jgi:YesN/AraC family two-component response regulator
MNKYQNLDPNLGYFVYTVRDIEWELNDLMNSHALLFILDGKVEYEIKGEKYIFGKNDMVYIQPGTFRKAKTKWMKVVAFDMSVPGVDDIGLPLVIHISDMSKYIPYFQSINNEWIKKGFEYRLKCKGYLLLVLHMLFSELDEQPRNNMVEDMKTYIVENYDQPLTVNEIAEVMGINTVYCGALFKKYEKCTINHYINQIRINQAISYMRSTSMNISETGYRVGFNDAYYFSRIFKKFAGVSPSDYRKSFLRRDI